MTHNPIEDCGACTLGRACRPGPCPFHDLHRPAGTILLPQGETPACVWFVRSGTVLITSLSEAGDETLCALRGPGSLIGLEALRERATDYEAWALSDVVACRIDAASFRAWVGERVTPIGAVLEIALDEAAQRHDERLALAGRSVERVARFLLERRRIERCDQPLHVEKRVLARMLGMRAETLSRALHRLRDGGAIAPERPVRVIDPDALARLATGDAP
jgi:CRP-like cAMP-binding protein